MNIQESIREHYERWMALDKYTMPTLADGLDFMITEVSEAIDKRLRRGSYHRNNTKLDNTDKDIAVEVFDVIMMGCVVLDILGYKLEDLATEKLAYMDELRTRKE